MDNSSKIFTGSSNDDISFVNFFLTLSFNLTVTFLPPAIKSDCISSKSKFITPKFLSLAFSLISSSRSKSPFFSFFSCSSSTTSISIFSSLFSFCSFWSKSKSGLFFNSLDFLNGSFNSILLLFFRFFPLFINSSNSSSTILSKFI